MAKYSRLQRQIDKIDKLTTLLQYALAPMLLITLLYRACSSNLDPAGSANLTILVTHEYSIKLHISS